MTPTVKTFGSMHEAAVALVSHRNARFISGGTLPTLANFRKSVFQGGCHAPKRQLGS